MPNPEMKRLWQMPGGVSSGSRSRENFQMSKNILGIFPGEIWSCFLELLQGDVKTLGPTWEKSWVDFSKGEKTYWKPSLEDCGPVVINSGLKIKDRKTPRESWEECQVNPEGCSFLQGGRKHLRQLCWGFCLGSQLLRMDRKRLQEVPGGGTHMDPGRFRMHKERKITLGNSLG